MRNDIISLEKYISIFAFLSVVTIVRLQFGQTPMQKKNSTLNFFHIVIKQLIEKPKLKNIYAKK